MPLSGDYVVMSAPLPEGERFTIFRQEEGASAVAQWLLAPDRSAAFEQMMKALVWLTEAETRQSLAAIGIAAAEIDAEIAAARRKAAVMLSEPTLIERITEPGYRNREGQEVLGKTDHHGPEGQCVFLMRCTVCGQQYGAYGIDADIRRCPQCQDGLPGVL